MSLINQIILLQEVDNKLFEIEKLLGDLPSKVEELTQNEVDIKTSLQNKENELKEISVLISTNETLIETTSEKINFLKDLEVYFLFLMLLLHHNHQYALHQKRSGELFFYHLLF